MTKKHKPRAPKVTKATKGRQTVVELDPDEDVDAHEEPAYPEGAQPGSQPLFKPKWERFAQLVCGGMTHEDAHENAGFKRDAANARRLALKDAVRTRIDWLKRQGADLAMSGVQTAIETSGLNLDWIVSRLMSNAERCRQGVPVTIAGVPTGEWKFDPAGSNRALELLGKIVGSDGALAAKERETEQGHVAKSVADPQVVTDILNVQKARKLLVVGGTDEAREKKPA